MMYSARYNPFLPVTAGFIVFTSANKILRMITTTSFGMLAVIQAIILVLAAIAFIMLLVRKHVVATEEVLQIRESCMRIPKEININEINEVRWGMKDSGTWTKGKQQFTVSMQSGEKVDFYSLSWLPGKERRRFFDYLRSKGVRIIE